MTNIFEMLPKDHFGKVYRDVEKDVLSRQSVGVYGMPGIGVQYFLRILESQLLQNELFRRVLFFRGSVLSKDINKTIEKRILRDATGKGIGLDEVLEQYSSERRLCIIIDGLPYVENPSEVLAFLWSIRKTNQSGVTVVVGMNHQMFSSLDTPIRTNPNVLASLHCIPLFDAEGTKRILDINNKFFKWSVPLDLSKKIHQLSGGNARFIKYIGKAVDDLGSSVLDDLDALRRYPLLEYRLGEFAHILFELTPNNLQKLEIVNSQGQLFSPLLEYFLMHYEVENVDSLVPGLSEKEKRLFSYLFANRGRVVTRDQLDFILGLVGEKYSLWAEYKAVERLKRKVEDRFSLKVVKGRGYVME